VSALIGGPTSASSRVLRIRFSVRALLKGALAL